MGVTDVRTAAVNTYITFHSFMAVQGQGMDTGGRTLPSIPSWPSKAKEWIQEDVHYLPFLHGRPRPRNGYRRTYITFHSFMAVQGQGMEDSTVDIKSFVLDS